MGRRFHGKPTKWTLMIGYYTRSIKRAIEIAFWLFVLFLVIMGIIYAVPKIWHLALG